MLSAMLKYMFKVLKRRFFLNYYFFLFFFLFFYIGAFYSMFIIGMFYYLVSDSIILGHLMAVIRGTGLFTLSETGLLSESISVPYSYNKYK